MSDKVSEMSLKASFVEFKFGYIAGKHYLCTPKWEELREIDN